MPPRGRRTPPAPRRPAKGKEDWRPHVDKAWIAAREAAKLLPTFTSFARSITGNRTVRVVLGDSFKTDGHTIMITPPIALGEERQHDKHICSKRGKDKRMLCPACDAREMLLWPLYHEIGHIAFNSNDPPEDYHRGLINKVVEEWHPYRVCAHGLLMKEKIRYGRSCLALAAAFDPYLAQLTNAFEDARVNSSMFRARAGLRVMFDAGTQRAFESGVEVPHTDEVVMWSDADPNAQVVIGLFLIASGYEVEENYLREEVREVLEDEELIRIAESVPLARNPKQVFERAVEAWLRLQKLGVCHHPKCEPTPDMPSLGNDGGEGGDKPNNDKSDGAPPESGSDGSGDSGSGTGDTPSGGAGAEPGRPDGEPPAGGSPMGGKADGEPSSGAGGGDSTDGGDGGLDHEDKPGDTPSEPSDVRDGGDSGSPDDRDEPMGSSGGDGDPRSGDDADTDSSASDSEGTGEEGSGSAGDDDRADGSSASSESEESEEHRDGSDSDADASSARDEGSGPEESEAPSDKGDGSDSDADPATEGDDSLVDGESDDDGPDAESDGRVETDRSDEGGSDGEYPEAELTEDFVDYDDMSSPVGSLSPGHKLPVVFEPGDPEILGKFLNLFNCHKMDSDPGEHAVEHGMEMGPADGGPLDEATLEAMKMAVEIAVVQSELFDKVSIGVTSVQHTKFPQPSINWSEGASSGWGERALTVKDIEVAGSIVNSATMKARLVFEDNARARNERGLKAGRLDSRMLGRRVPVDDDRLFKKKTRLAKKEYAVLIGIDCSGSTMSNNRLTRMKKAVWAQAEMLNRLGIKFAIYGHSGTTDNKGIPRGLRAAREDDPYGYDDPSYSYALQIMEIKGFETPWDNRAKTALASLTPQAANLDGHTMQYYRHIVEQRRESDKVLMYYTDGSMPLENYDEELEILQSELVVLKRKRITTMAVGIDTDAPMQYGLDTCIVRSDADIPGVVDHLKKRLIG